MHIQINELIEEKYDVEIEVMNTKSGVLNFPPLENGLSRKEQSFLNMAYTLAEASEVDKRHGAVIVKNGRVMSLGINKWRNKGLEQEHAYWLDILTVHAERDALSRVSDARGAVVYIARVGKEGERLMSRPCWRCMKALAEAGVKRVIYTVGEAN